MPPLRKDFGNRLRTIRQQRNLTQEQFAELVGISADFLSLIERGRKRLMDASQNVAVAASAAASEASDLAAKILAMPEDKQKLLTALL